MLKTEIRVLNALLLVVYNPDSNDEGLNKHMLKTWVQLIKSESQVA